ncbi:MAG: VRR-NUC domain-containing protein, partial [Janthinobacterium sp.]
NLLQRAQDDAHRGAVQEAAQALGLPVVAVGHVCMHVRSRKPLLDTLCAIRVGKPVGECGYALAQNAEQHLRARLRLANVYPPQALAETLRIAKMCKFSLDSLRYDYPDELVPHGYTPATYLREETYAGARIRFPLGIPANVQQQIEHELELIADLSYEPYFLTVYDIVRFARSQNILCQGRGSAANSAVCYCLHITEVDPARGNSLVERFMSRERNEPPDIDVDFEHQRREEVIQYIYGKYGRERAALAAVVISYRPKSALRDSGRALGIDLAIVEKVAKAHRWFDGKRDLLERLAECGLDPEAALSQQWASLAQQLLGFPRHLSQHPGGFVIAQGKLSRLVPIENATMAERSVIEWDKNDLEELGLMKVDVLALGMLSALRRALELVGARRGEEFRLQDIPREDPATYDMMCEADTIGVFQIESRAQMSMLPRLRRSTGAGAAQEKRRRAAALAPAVAGLRSDVTLALPAEPMAVEYALRDHWQSEQAPVFYVENALINSLFGLLCWPAIFAPLPGAFFHPFQSGPADLSAPDFVPRRQELFDACLQALADGSYRRVIAQRFAEKQGLQSPFVFWGALSEELLTLALDCIPAAHLQLFFARLLRDVKGN